MYFRTFSTVRASDPEEKITPYGRHGDLRRIDAPYAVPDELSEEFSDLYAYAARLWKKYLHVFG